MAPRNSFHRCRPIRRLQNRSGQVVCRLPRGACFLVVSSLELAAVTVLTVFRGGACSQLCSLDVCFNIRVLSFLFTSNAISACRMHRAALPPVTYQVFKICGTSSYSGERWNNEILALLVRDEVILFSPYIIAVFEHDRRQCTPRIDHLQIDHLQMMVQIYQGRCVPDLSDLALDAGREP